MPKYRVETDKGVYEIETADAGAAPAPAPAAQTQAAAPQHWSDRAGLTNPAARGAVDFVEGAASGLASTIFNGGDVIRRMSGMERVIDRPEVKQAMATPPSLAGSAGRFIEQTGEFLLPGVKVGNAVRAAKLPVRMAADAATAGTVAGAQTGGDVQDVLTAAATGGALTGVTSLPFARGLARSAEKSYAKVLGDSNNAREVIPGLLDRGVKAVNRKSLYEKAAVKASEIGRSIDDAWSNVPPDMKLEAKPILNAFKKHTDRLTVAGPSGQGRVPMGPVYERSASVARKLQNSLEVVTEIDPQTGAHVIPAGKLRAVKQMWDEIGETAGVFKGKNIPKYHEAKIHSMAADSIRNELDKALPDIAAINKEFHFWSTVKDAAKVAANRSARGAKPLDERLPEAVKEGSKILAASSLLGGAGEVLKGLVSTTAWRTVSAVQKQKLADAIARGHRGEIEFYVRKIARATALEFPITMRHPGQNLSPAPAQ